MAEHTEHGQRQDAPDAEMIPVSRSERIAGWVGILVCAGLILICVDLATGGRISGKLARPAAPCGCGEGGDD